MGAVTLSRRDEEICVAHIEVSDNLIKYVDSDASSEQMWRNTQKFSSGGFCFLSEIESKIISSERGVGKSI